MGNYTNEKSLVVVEDNFLTKIKSFFARTFWGRKSKYDMIEDYEENEAQNDEENELEEPAKKERRLYNFDADNNDDWPGDDNMNNDERNVNSVDDENNEVNEESLEEYYEKEEECSEAYREKLELEQKLMNYYESIKKRTLVPMGTGQFGIFRLIIYRTNKFNKIGKN